MAILVDWAKQTVSGTPGTGTITLSTAVTGFIKLQDDTRLVDGGLVYYSIADGSNFERGIGTYTASGTTLARTVIHAKYESGTYTENPGTGLTLTSAAIVSCSAVAATHNFRGATVYNTSLQSISTGTGTSCTWSTALYDTDGFFNSGVSTTKFIIPSGKGIRAVKLTGNTYFASATTGLRATYFMKNAEHCVPSGRANHAASASIDSSFNLKTGRIPCTDGDEFELYVFQSSGGAVNVGYTTIASSIHCFSIEVVE